MAEYYKADRVEICSRLDLDGLTPDRLIIEETISSLSIPVKVMIRPKSDNFIYSDLETIKMESDIEFCKEIGVSEVVFGEDQAYAIVNGKELPISTIKRVSMTQ